MHYIIINVQILDEKNKEFIQSVNELLKSIYSSQNIKSGIYQDVVDNTRYRYWEEWHSLEKMQNHLKSDNFRALLGGMKVLGKISEAKSIQADSITDIR